MSWNATDPQGHEANKVKFEVVPYLRGAKVLDLGCGPDKAFPGMIGVDSCKDTELFGIQMKPDVVVDTCEVLPYADGECDGVFSSHLIEHLDDPQAALHEWWRVLKVGGHLTLYWPDPDEYPRVGTPGANPDHVADYMPDDMIAMMEKVGSWDLLMNERRNQRQEYSVLQVYEKLVNPQ